MVLALPLRASKQVPDPVFPMVLAAGATLVPGHADRRAALLLGVLGTMTATTRAVLPVVRLPGPVIVAIGIAIAATAEGTTVIATEATATTVVVRASTVAAPRPLELPPHGINPWLLRPRMADTPATALTVRRVLLREWAVRLPACLLRLLVALLLASLVGSTRSSSNTPTQLPHLLPLLPRLETPRRPRPLPWTCRPLRLALRRPTSGRLCRLTLFAF